MATSENAAFCSSVRLTGSMAPFCTRLPIQSCAPIITSGPLPCWEAVRKVCWLSLLISFTSTVTPFSVPNWSAKGARALTRLGSAQMTSLPEAGAAEADSLGAAEGAAAGSDPPQAVRASVVRAATPRARFLMRPPERSWNRRFHGICFRDVSRILQNLEDLARERYPIHTGRSALPGLPPVRERSATFRKLAPAPAGGGPELSPIIPPLPQFGKVLSLARQLPKRAAGSVDRCDCGPAPCGDASPSSPRSWPRSCSFPWRSPVCSSAGTCWHGPPGTPPGTRRAASPPWPATAG